MSDILTEVKFWAQIIDDARRTIYCAPDLESRIAGWIDARGMGGVLTVHATTICPDDRIIVVDEPAIEATMRKWAQRPIKFNL